ncbi:sulfotransferase domain-containing protein [Sphingomonas sp. NPDC092331]|jgi:Sulfotransferase domain|uniref:sulfotransferase domain-containing protein n=2 Tax=Pseudomonadota TaxID=1224 RepID=UPI0031F498B1
MIAERPLKFIDVSGVGNTGKSAVVDLLREIDGLWVPEYWFEFDLLRVPGGMLDLRHALLEDWSPIRSHDAWLRFRDVVRKMGVDPQPWEVRDALDSTGQRYDRRFQGRFVPLALAFADSFRLGAIRSEWPYEALRDGRVERIARKLLRRAGLRRYITREVHLLDGKDFDARATAFLTALFAGIVPEDATGVVLNNGFEPYHPQPALDMIAGARQIVVTRDPRDIYVSGLNAHNVSGGDKALIAFDNDGMNKSFLATDDLAKFVARFRLYHDQLGGDDPRVLKLQFETIMRDYDAQVRRVLDFLGIDPARHVRPRTRLDPERSGRNIGIWQQYSRRDEIAYIERELAPYLYHG